MVTGRIIQHRTGNNRPRILRIIIIVPAWSLSVTLWWDVVGIGSRKMKRETMRPMRNPTKAVPVSDASHPPKNQQCCTRTERLSESSQCQ